MESRSDEEFRFVIEATFTVTGRGLVLAGTIESGVVRTGDRLNLIEGGKVVGEVTAYAVESVLAAGRPDLIGILVRGLQKGDAKEGQLLVGTGRQPSGC